jgi:hypothetical protein
MAVVVSDATNDNERTHGEAIVMESTCRSV